MIFKRLALISFGTLLGLLFVELTLRVAGAIYEATHPPPERSPTEFAVFCLGESSTWGIGATNPSEQRYPKQLERMLEDVCAGKQPRCFFDQTIGQNSSEILLKLPRYLRKYDPDLLIVMVGANNWWNLRMTNPLLFSRNKSVSRTTLSILSMLDNFRIWNLVKRSGLGPSIYDSRWDSFWPEGESRKKLISALQREFGEDIWDLIYEITLHDLQKIVEIAHSNNVEVIMASYPITGEITRGAQVTAAETTGCLFVDNYLIFRSLDNRSEVISDDGWHPNERGYRIVAEAFLHCILENDLMKCREDSQTGRPRQNHVNVVDSAGE